MSDSTPTALSLGQLPLEVLLAIFYFLDIPDILRMRRVCRYMNRVSHGRDVWCDAYRKAKFVRPPGPFPSQSTCELESTLVSSFRVNRNLRHGSAAVQTERSTSKLREIWYTNMDLRVSLVFGRFLIIALSEEVRCYDLDLEARGGDPGASILYRSTGGTLRSFHCVSAIDVQGRPFACAVLNEEKQTTRRISVCSLNVGEPSKVTLDLLHQFENCAFNIDAVDLGPRVIVIRGRVGRDLDTDRRLIALDVCTCKQYLLPPFPPFTHVMWGTAEVSESTPIERIILPTSISTSTHLLFACSFYTPATGWRTFFQAFTLPCLATSRCLTSASIPLSLSHCGTIPGISVYGTVLLHDAVLDSSTQDVLIAIRVHAFEPSYPVSPVLKYGILRLSAAHTSHDHDSEVGTITFQLLSLLGRSRTPFPHPSFNGTGRVFYTHKTSFDWIVVALEYDLHASGDDNDVEHGAKVTEYPCILRFSTPRTLLDYDPYSGRICLRSATAEGNVIEVLDLAV